MFNLSRLIGLFLATIDGWSQEMDWVGCVVNHLEDSVHSVYFPVCLVNTGEVVKSHHLSLLVKTCSYCPSLPQSSQTVNWVKTHFSLFSALLTLLCDTFCWLKLNTDQGENLLGPSDTQSTKPPQGLVQSELGIQFSHWKMLLCSRCYWNEAWQMIFFQVSLPLVAKEVETI